MKIPLAPFIFLGKTGYNLYNYFYKGPKVDASLKLIDSSQKLRGASHLNPTDKPVFFGEAINVFNFTSRFNLTLKNTSKSPAYNIRLVNSKDIFSSNEDIEQLTILNPGESISIICFFHTQEVHVKSFEREIYHGIPKEKKSMPLIVAYENEARTTFYTKFIVDDMNAINNYSLKKP